MKTISIVNGKTKRNLYITVAALYLVISAFFLVNTEYQYRKTKQILISETLRNQSERIHQCFTQVASTFNQAVSVTINNSNFTAALAVKDHAQITKSLQPVLNSVILPLNAFVAIYSAEGQELFNSSTIPLKNVKKYSITFDTTDHIKQHIAIGSGELYYLRTYEVQTSGIALSLIVGVRDVDGMSFLGTDSSIVPIVLIDSNQIFNRDLSFGLNLNSSIVRSYHNTEIVEQITKILNLNDNVSGSTVKVERGVYALADVTEQFFPTSERIAKTIFAIDITSFHKTYQNHISRLLAFILLFFIVVYLIVRIFHNRIIGTMLSVEKKLEIKLNARTRRLIDHNEQLNQIFNSTANGIRIIDKNFSVINANSSFCVLTGMKSNDIVGNKCYEVFPSNSCHTTNCPLEQIKQGLSVVQTKEVRFNPLGKKIVCQYRAMPFLTKEGELIGIIEDFKDITDLHLAQEAVHQTQRQFESLLDSMPVGVFIRDFDGNMFYQNTYMNKVFGPVEEGRNNLKSIYPSQVSRFFEEDKLVDKYGLFVGEEKLVDSNGVERTYVTHKFKFSGINNKALIGGVSIDITKRKKAEQNSYVLSKAIVNSPIGVLITSPEGIVEFCNPEFEKYSGLASEAILGNSFHYFNPKQFNKLQEPISVAKNGGVYQGELQLSLNNNYQQWFAVSIAPVFNREGSIAHLIFVFDNTTERKEYEKEIEIAKSRAEESDRLKTAFLSNLSHEIRTPLNAILGFSSLLNNPSISDDDKLEIPALLVNHSNNLLELINDLIDVAAIETNQFTVSKTECRLNGLLLDAFNDITLKSKQLKEKKIKTNIKLGIQEESFTISTDPKRLAQVINHLVSNAIKFTNSGFVEFGYTLKDANNLLFYIIDTGVGLSEEEKSIIFNPFRQADDSRTRSFNGLGLGLAISKHIIDRLGGKIWVNSVKGQGSTFFFTLPYIPIKTKFDPVVLPPKHKEIFNWHNKTILVADDIDSNYMFIQTLLKPTGAKLMWAKNGQEAVDVVKSHKIDVILMDIVMPEVDGFEATRLIKKFDRNIKVICQTAYPSTDHHVASEECGMDGFLAKPIAPYSILKTIDDFLIRN